MTVAELKFTIPNYPPEIFAQKNPLTGDWLVYGQNNAAPYVTRTKEDASQMLQTINHFNETGQIKRFKKVKMISLTKE